MVSLSFYNIFIFIVAKYAGISQKILQPYFTEYGTGIKCFTYFYKSKDFTSNTVKPLNVCSKSGLAELFSV